MATDTKQFANTIQGYSKLGSEDSAVSLAADGLTRPFQADNAPAN